MFSSATGTIREMDARSTSSEPYLDIERPTDLMWLYCFHMRSVGQIYSIAGQVTGQVLGQTADQPLKVLMRPFFHSMVQPLENFCLIPPFWLYSSVTGYPYLPFSLPCLFHSAAIAPFSLMM